MSFLAWLLLSAGASEPVHWLRLADPGDPVVAIAAMGQELVVLSPGGRLRIGDERGWRGLAPATGQNLDQLVVHGDQLWAWQETPAVARVWDGRAWSPSERVPLEHLTNLVPLADGRLVASGIAGGVAIRDLDGSWTAHSLTAGHLFVQADGRGGLWWLTEDNGGEVLHTDPSLAINGRWPDAPAWSRITAPAAVTAGGELVVAGDTLRRFTPEGEEVLVAEQRFGVVVSGGSVWSWDDQLDRDQEALPTPTEVRRAAPTAEGGLWVLGADGALFVSRPGASLTLRDATTSAAVGALPPGRGAVGDLDGDGLDDVVVFPNFGESAVWVQREGRFVPWTRLAAHTSRGVVGDVDGNGVDDVVLLVVRDDSLSGELALWRGLAGRLEAVPGAFDRQPDPIAVAGHPQLLDLDGDGDLDLALTGGGRADLEERVALWENIGHGRFAWRALSGFGLDGDRRFVSRALAEDLDHDGDPDLILTGLWGGHQLFEGTPGGWRAVSPSGLEGVFGTSCDAALRDFNGDGSPDLVTGCGAVTQVFFGHGLGFAARAGPDPLASWPLMTGIASGDLDGDGFDDLVACDEARCTLALGSSGGLVESSGLIPILQGGLALNLVDLGGDGDLDVLITGARPALLENLGAARARPLAVGPAWSSEVRRKLVWAAGADWLLLALGLAGWLAGGALARRERGHVLGRVWPAALLGLVAAPTWLAVADLPLAARVAWGTGQAALALGAGWIEALWTRETRARWVGGFRLLTLLGSGGMGTVWRARAPSGPDVALKIVHPDLLLTEEDRRLYREEARIGADFDHPGLVRILGYGEWTVMEGDRERPTAYLVMERIDGSTMRDVLASRGPLPVGEAAALVRQVCLALDVVHRLGVVHRDVKPSNVMIARGSQPRAVLMDFGAARYVGQVTQRSRDVIGTIGYLAPEQGMGDPPAPPADLYAAGIVLYELLAGRRPFEADNLVTLMGQVFEGDPAPLDRPDVPEALQALIRRAIARHARDRFPNASQMARALEPYCTAIQALPSGSETGEPAPTVPATVQDTA